MKLYLATIGIAAAIIAAVNLALETASWYYILIATVWCVLLDFSLDGLMAIVIRLTPNRWYPIDSPYFAVSDREACWHKKLKVRLWKDYVWELGGLGGFSKKNLVAPDEPAYIERFIIECHKGVMTHRLSYPIGLLAMLTLPNRCAFTIALPAALVNLFLNILPTLVLRYNTPKLQRVLKRLLRKHVN
ncbi:MAG: hypothetical protein E7618_03340 [Ruminococcaceae bacterium]|nr:hypothetical protein [Oscillospiraceae bacterium]